MTEKSISIVPLRDHIATTTGAKSMAQSYTSVRDHIAEWAALEAATRGIAEVMSPKDSAIPETIRAGLQAALRYPLPVFES